MIPKVSINIPVYNAEKYIKQAIGSVLGQTEKDIEVIVVDDGSTDATIEVVKSFSDERLRLFINKHNRGVSYTRNQALKQSRGNWIAPLDADDWYALERIEKTIQIAISEDADLVADDLYFINDESEQPDGTLLCVDQKNFDRDRLISAVEFLESNMKPAKSSPHLGLAKPLIKRSFLLQHNLQYNETLSLLEDFHLYMMCLAKGARFVVSPKPYYFYRRSRQNSLSTAQRINLLEQKRRANLLLLQHPCIKNDAVLFSHITEFNSKIDQEIDYCTIAQIFKEGGTLQTLGEMFRNPRFFFIHCT